MIRLIAPNEPPQTYCSPENSPNNKMRKPLGFNKMKLNPCDSPDKYSKFDSPQ